MDMSKYRGMFLTESREHLRNLSRLLITLEANPADGEVIATLFREAHSVKGMAASMGFEQTAELAHHLEDYLDGFRKQGQVPPAAVDRLLAGLDLLEGLLEDLEADRPEREVAPFIGAAAAAPAGESLPEAEMEVLEAELIVPPEAAAATLQLTVTLAEEAAAPAARALLILLELGRLGEVLKSIPDQEQLKRGEPARSLEVQLRTASPATQVEKAIATMADVSRVRLGTPVAAPPKPAGRREEAPRTVRVRTDLLDRFINLTGELITDRYMLKAAARQQRWEELSAGLDHLSRLITDLHHHVLQVRMMPLESITGRLPRTVRDLARKTGKSVTLQVSGEELELDRAILEELADPLVHLVRNAVDHGIEASGEIQVRAWREKDLALLEVVDNGRGMDPEVIRRRAVAKGLISAAQGRTLRDRETLQLVCTPGFSTAAEVTETSGRGVGMDVVKSAVENLGGTLEITSQPGKGTRMRVQLPLSVAIIQILLVECAGRTVGIPITRVRHTLEVARRQVHSSGRQMVIDHRGELVPLLSLRKMLRLPAQPHRGAVPVVLTEGRGRTVGLVVDRLVGQREAFVKPLNFPLDRLGGVNGATVLGDGSIVFIIDPQHLLEERSTRSGERP